MTSILTKHQCDHKKTSRFFNAPSHHQKQCVKSRSGVTKTAENGWRFTRCRSIVMVLIADWSPELSPEMRNKRLPVTLREDGFYYSTATKTLFVPELKTRGSICKCHLGQVLWEIACQVGTHQTGWKILNIQCFLLARRVCTHNGIFFNVNSVPTSKIPRNFKFQPVTQKNCFSFSNVRFSQHWWCVHVIWKHSLWREGTHLYISNLTSTQGTSASVALVLTYFSRNMFIF